MRTTLPLACVAVFLLLSLRGSPAHAVVFTIGDNFTGTDLNDEFGLGGGFIPPDTMGAVGPSHVADILNGAFAVYNKSGVLQSRVTLDSFWNTAFTNAGTVATSSSTFDPRILYDKGSSRWYAVAVDQRNSAGSRIHVGVTTGSDPALANWRGFVIDADPGNTHWADFPTVGVNADGLYISNNMFTIGGGVGNQITIAGIPKSSLTAVTPSIAGFQLRESLAGTSVVSGQFDINDIGFSYQPAVDMDNGSLPLPGLSAYNPSFVKRTFIPANFFSGGTIADQAFPGDFISSSQPAPPDAHQPAPGPDTIDTNDPRFSGNVVLQDGKLWGVQSIGSGGRSALQWYRINAGTNALEQSGIISDAVLDLYFPSIAVNNTGNVVIGFSGSSDVTPASTYVAVGETLAGVTAFDPIVQTHLGNGTYQRLDGNSRNRWGDYSATVVDPADENAFWTFQEFVDGTNNWAVRITEINIGAVVVGNDSTISVTTATPIALGRVMLNQTPSSTVTLDKTGTSATTYSVTADAGLSHNADGSIAADPQTETFDLTLQNNAAGSATTGSKSYQVTVDNTAADSAAAGQGSDDPDDVFNVTATVVDNRQISASAVAFGNVFAGAAVSGATSLTTTGNDNERTRVTVQGTAVAADANGIGVDAGSSQLFDGPADTTSRNLSGTFSAAGNASGGLNLSVTGEGLAGESVQPVTASYTATIYDHGNGSFDDPADVNLRVIDFGTWAQGSVVPDSFFDVFNLIDTPGFTAGVTFGASGTGDTTVLTTNLPGIGSPIPLAAGASQQFSASFDTSAMGAFEATYTIDFDDDSSIFGAGDLPNLTLVIRGQVAIPEPGTLIMSVLGGCLAAFWAARRQVKHA